MIILQCGSTRIDAVEFSPGGRGLAALSSVAVLVWEDVAAGSPTYFRAYQQGESLRFTPDGVSLLVGGPLPGRLDLTSKADRSIPREAPTTAYLDLTPDGRSAVIVERQRLFGHPASITLRPLDDLSSATWRTETSRWTYAPPLFLDAERFALFEWNQQSWLVTRDLRTGAVLSEVRSGFDRAFDPVQSRDRRLIAARYQSEITVAPEGSSAPVVIRNDSRKHFTGLAFHPSGRFLAATSNDKTVKLYDTQTWKLAHAFDWDVGRLRSIAFSPDGSLAAAGGDKGKIVVWDFDL